MPLTRKPNIAQAKTTIRQAGTAGVLASLEAVKKRHMAIVRPWREADDKPIFTIGTEYRNRLLVGWVKMEGTNAVSAHKTVWQLLEHGTRIRFMDVSEDWVSKTKPGQLSSGAGRGNVMGLNFKDPNPGILARNWGPGIAKEQEENTNRNIRRAWASGFTKGIG